MATIDNLKKKKPEVSIALLKIGVKPKTSIMSDHPMMDAPAPTTPAEPTSTSKPVEQVPVETKDEDVEVVKQGSLAEALQLLLNDAFNFYITTHQFHWNIVGPDFAEFHEFFNNIYEDAFSAIDPMAECIRKLGELVDMELGEIDECESLEDMLHCLTELNNNLIIKLKDTIDMANKDREQGILNFLADRLDKHEMWRWQLLSTMS